MRHHLGGVSAGLPLLGSDLEAVELGDVLAFVGHGFGDAAGLGLAGLVVDAVHDSGLHPTRFRVLVSSQGLFVAGTPAAACALQGGFLWDFNVDDPCGVSVCVERVHQRAGLVLVGHDPVDQEVGSTRDGLGAHMLREVGGFLVDERGQLQGEELFASVPSGLNLGVGEVVGF